MATRTVCDRCGYIFADDETPIVVSFAMGEALDEEMSSEGNGYAFGPEEVCTKCAERIEKLAKNMKLGPDAVPGGIRRGRKK